MGEILNNQALGFIKKGFTSTEAAAAAATAGKIVFDSTAKIIYVDGQAYGGNITDATFVNGVLTITKATGEPIAIDFSDIASASSMMAVFQQFADRIGLTGSDNGLDYSGTNYLKDLGATGKPAKNLVNADKYLDSKIKDLADATDDAVNNMNGTAVIASEADGIVTIKSGVIQSDGKIANDSGDGIELAKVATTGAATDVNFAPYTPDGLESGEGIESTDVQSAIEEVVDKIIDNEKVTVDAFEAVQNAVGLGENLNYVAPTGTEYLDSSTSVMDALKKLDKAVDDAVGGGITDVTINGTSVKDANTAIIAVDGTYDAANNKIATESTITTKINSLNGTATIASESNGIVTIKTGVTETDGVISNDSGADIVLKKVATTGTAADVAIVDGNNRITATDVEGALDELALAIANLKGEFDTVVSTDAATTPAGISWDNAGTTVTGTLTASETTWHKVYLVPTSGTSPNQYSEYITRKIGTNDYAWEKLGDVAVDLTGYVKTIVVNGQTYEVTGTGTSIQLPEVITAVNGETAISGGNSDYVAVSVSTGTAANGSKEVTLSSTVKTQAVSTADTTNDGLATAKDVKDYVDTKAAVVNSDPTIKVNDANSAQIGTVGGTALTAKVALYWDEWETNA